MSAYFPFQVAPPAQLADLDALRAADPSANRAGQLFYVEDGALALRMYRWDAVEDAADDGDRVLKPDGVSEDDPGRYVAYATAAATPNALVLRDGDGNIPGVTAGSDFEDPVLHVNAGGAVPSAGLYGLSVDFTAGANRRGLFWDAANATWAAAQDTLGDDATISSYLKFRADEVKARSFASDGTGGADFVAMQSGDEVRARVGSVFRLAAALAGPTFAFGDAALATLTIDALTTLRATSQAAVELRAGTALTVKDAAGANLLATFDLGAGLAKVTGKLAAYDATGASEYFEVSGGTTTAFGNFRAQNAGGTATPLAVTGDSSLVQVNGELVVKDSTGATTFLDVQPAGGAALLTGTFSASVRLKSPALDTPSAAALTVGGTATSVAFSGLPLTGIASVDNSGATQSFGLNTTGQTAGKAATTWALLGLLTVAGATAMSDALTVNKDGINTTKTFGITAANATVSGSQVSPQLGVSAKHSGGTQHNFGLQIEPQSASRAISRFLYGTGTSPPSSTGFLVDTSDASFGLSVQAACFVSTLGTGFRLVLNGGGVKENGSGRALFQSASSGEPWEALASTSTGNTGARFQLTADAGTPSAGYLLRVGFGSGSFSTSKFDLYYDGRLGLANVDPTAAGLVGMNTTTGRLRLYVGGAADSAAVLADVGGAPLQSGTATLSSGVTGAITATVTANTRIVGFMKTPSGTTLTTEYAALDADRSVGGPGSFKITALVAAGTINTADNSSLDWLAIG